jgi:hypothetical protein
MLSLVRVGKVLARRGFWRGPWAAPAPAQSPGNE